MINSLSEDRIPAKVPISRLFRFHVTNPRTPQLPYLSQRLELEMLSLKIRWEL